MTVTQWQAAGYLTEAKLNLIRGCRNKVNSVVWYGTAIGEAFFKGWRLAARSSNFITLEFTFLISRNRLAGELPTYYNRIGTPYTITNGKKGWEYLWEQSAEAVVAGAEPHIYSKGVYVAKVYETNNFSGTGLSGAL